MVESQSKELWLVSFVTRADIIAQVSLPRLSIFLFLDMPNLKLRIIIIILSISRSEKVIVTARTTKK